LFFEGLDGSVMRVAVEATGSAWSARPPERLFTPGYLPVGSLFGTGGASDISPDGRRFLMIRPDPASLIAPVVIVQNWDLEFQRLAPAN
jgi:hypothetical protein